MFMTGFFKKIFGLSKGNGKEAPEALLHEVLNGVIERGNFDLSFTVKEGKDSEVFVEFFGEDEYLLKEKDGVLLDALQLFAKRAVQHHFPEHLGNLNFDVDGFREEANQALIDLADKLKGIALDKGKSVYFRALPPKDRKVIHQYLASDERVKSRSIGDGLYKKIKIYPVKSSGAMMSHEG
jgi:spoIIIJ-associated protein